MTTWTVVDDRDPDVSVSISAAGYAALARDYANAQRLDRAARTHQITAAVAGGLFVGAILIEALRTMVGG